MLNPKIIKSKFEKSLKCYDENAIVQKFMAKDLVCNISKFKKSFSNILELGSGTGILTGEITKFLEFNHYYFNDLTEKSESYIKKIIPDAVFYCGNAMKINPSNRYDLIASNAMFQWLDIGQLADKYKKYLNKGGFFAFSTFNQNNYKEIKALTGLSLEYPTEVEVKDIFSKDYRLLYANSFEKVLEFSTPLELLAHMKHTGVNSLSNSSWTIKDVKEFCDKYSEKYERVVLTYSPMIFVFELL